MTQVRGSERRFVRRRMQDKLAESRERERVLEALRASEARLRDAQALARIGSWELDLANWRVTWSEQMYAVTETDPATFTPTFDSVIRMIHPDERERAEQGFRRAVDAREAYVVDFRMLTPGGRIKFVQTRALLEFDAAGRPVRAVGTVQDMTALRQTERELADKSAELAERIKELRCINQVSDILAAGDADVAGLIAAIAQTIPPACKYPDIAVARIRLLDRVHATGDCTAPAATLAQDIVANGVVVGSIEVCYTQPRPPGDEGPFLREERDLVRLIARKIGMSIERRGDENRFRQLLESAPDAMVIVGRDGRIVLVNAQTERLFGYPRAELIGQPIEILIPERAVKAHEAHRHRYQQHPTVRPMGANLQLSARRRDGSEFPVEISLGPLDTADGALISAAVRDISERRRADIALQRLGRVRTMMSDINAMIVRAQGRDELFADACRIAVERGGFRMAWIGVREADGFVRPVAHFGVNGTYLDGLCVSTDPHDTRGRGPTATALREDHPVVINDIAGTAIMQPWQAAAAERGLRASAAFPLHLNDAVAGVLNFYAGDVDFFDDDEIELLKELASDISFAMQSIEQKRQLEYLAYYDPLTQVANRALFKDRLTQFLAVARGAGHQLALMVLDLERFKALNDALGAAAGDTLLRTVARRLQIAVGAGERVARISGDRFALIVPRVLRTAELVARLKDRVLAGLAEPVVLAGETYHPTARVGIALFPDDGDDAEALFRNAEAALKRAKVSRDRYLFYTQAMNETVRDRLSLESQIHRAIRNDELRLYYQPKIELRSGRITGVEALLRWPTQQGFATGCGRLIEVLEDNGGIVEVGRWAIRQALHDRQAWRGAGLVPPSVAVNVSMRQLQNPAFVDEVAQALRNVPGWDAGVAPGIEVELTESTLMQDIDASIDKLQRLRELGLPIAIDDFGSGYSSLSYLSRLPISVLKIDQDFVRPMLQDERAANLVVAIISMARSLHLKVVAEGVEDAEQLAFLRRHGCDEIQGFLIGPAVPAVAMADLLRKGSMLPASADA